MPRIGGSAGRAAYPGPTDQVCDQATEQENTASWRCTAGLLSAVFLKTAREGAALKRGRKSGQDEANHNDSEAEFDTEDNRSGVGDDTDPEQGEIWRNYWPHWRYCITVMYSDNGRHLTGEIENLTSSSVVGKVVGVDSPVEGKVEGAFLGHVVRAEANDLLDPGLKAVNLIKLFNVADPTEKWTGLQLAVSVTTKRGKSGGNYSEETEPPSDRGKDQGHGPWVVHKVN
ncbi:hypothetical protein EDB89DRAFT_1909227 [Lactarius sanguifluus]|nr:hypothetical protein EDB89DRAFT_1909227 [Lactarius sanguifluus]